MNQNNAYSVGTSEVAARAPRHKLFDKPQAHLIGLGSKLKFHRVTSDSGRGEALGFTQREAAEKAGLNRNTLSMLEQGKCEPHAEDLDALSKAYGLTDAQCRDLYEAADLDLPEALLTKAAEGMPAIATRQEEELPFANLESTEGFEASGLEALAPAGCVSCGTVDKVHFNYCDLSRVESDDTSSEEQGEQARGSDTDSLAGPVSDPHVNSEKGHHQYLSRNQAEALGLPVPDGAIGLFVLPTVSEKATSDLIAALRPIARNVGTEPAFNVACTCVDRKPGDLHAAECPVGEHLRMLDLQGLLPVQGEPVDWFELEAIKDSIGVKDSEGLVVPKLGEVVVDDLNGLISPKAANRLKWVLGSCATLKGDVFAMFTRDKWENENVSIFRVGR